MARPTRDSPTLRKSKKLVRERSGGWCEARLDGVCTGRGEQVHHIQRRSQGGSDEPENLLHVCSRCHTEIHKYPAHAVELGFLWQRKAS